MAVVKTLITTAITTTTTAVQPLCRVNGKEHVNCLLFTKCSGIKYMRHESISRLENMSVLLQTPLFVR